MPKGVILPRRISIALLLLAVSAGLPLQAIHAATTENPAAAKSTPTKTGSPRRAPAAKPSKTSKIHAIRSSSRTHTSHVAAVSLRSTTLAPLGGRQAVTERITQALASNRIGIENPQALRPFFDQLHQLEADPTSQLIRVIQFGDSHTAADIFTAAMRTLFQSKFGDGGAGFQYAGYPFAGYRIHGTKRAQSTGWIALGTHLRDIGDGLVGMGGISLSTNRAGNWVSLDADATSLEVQYLIQPNGGSIEIRDNDQLLATVSTAGPAVNEPMPVHTEAEAETKDPAAGHYDVTLPAGPHHIEVLTTQEAPVRLLGLSTENSSGVTYEAAGINGAEASLFLRWNEALQQTLMAAAKPSLIVLAYGTNEASDHNWTEESYAAMFRQIIERCRRLAPQASILVIGPPDRALRAGRRGWAPFIGVDRIIQAQRTVCHQMDCAYWDQRSRMGGYGSMRDWVSISWAQGDHTHFTGEGYNELASALFSDIVQQYNAGQAPPAKVGGDGQ
jgi:lysophospholipase L1-like esterase